MTHLLYKHDDGRYAVDPDTTGDPGWHRLGSVNPSSMLMHRALRAIRFAGNNSDPTCIWMQKLAANAMDPDKYPHPGEQPSHRESTTPPTPQPSSPPPEQT